MINANLFHFLKLVNNVRAFSLYASSNIYVLLVHSTETSHICEEQTFTN